MVREKVAAELYQPACNSMTWPAQVSVCRFVFFRLTALGFFLLLNPRVRKTKPSMLYGLELLTVAFYYQSFFTLVYASYDVYDFWCWL